MNFTDISGKRNYIKKAEKNVVIPWDDPYPNISETLTEEQQLLLKILNNLATKKEIEKQQKQSERAPSSSSTTKSIKFLENDDSVNRSNFETQPSGILKSRSSTKLSGLFELNYFYSSDHLFYFLIITQFKFYKRWNFNTMSID